MCSLLTGVSWNPITGGFAVRKLFVCLNLLYCGCRDLLDDRDVEIRGLQQMLANRDSSNFNNNPFTPSTSPSANQKSSSPAGQFGFQKSPQFELKSDENQRHTSPSPSGQRNKSPSSSKLAKNSVNGSPVSAYINNRTVENMRLELLEKREYIGRIEEKVQDLEQQVVTEKTDRQGQKDKDAATIRELQWQLSQLEKRWAMNANRDSVSALIRGGQRSSSPSKGATSFTVGGVLG